jgi:hypothetical protein
MYTIHLCSTIVEVVIFDAVREQLRVASILKLAEAVNIIFDII